MEIQQMELHGTKIAIVSSEEVLLHDTESALDFLMSVSYDSEIRRIALNKEAVADPFFVLSSGLAGEVLQKFVNYQAKLAIYGDFTCYTSKPLRDFIYESNCGSHIFFVPTVQAAAEKLSLAK